MEVSQAFTSPSCTAKMLTDREKRRKTPPLWQVQLPASANRRARPTSPRLQRERVYRLPRAKCSCSLRMCRCSERCLMLSGSTCTSCSSLLFASCNNAADLRFAHLAMGMAAGHRNSLCRQICVCSPDLEGRLQNCCFLLAIFKGCRDIYVLLSLNQITGGTSANVLSEQAHLLRSLCQSSPASAVGSPLLVCLCQSWTSRAVSVSVK